MTEESSEKIAIENLSIKDTPTGTPALSNGKAEHKASVDILTKISEDVEISNEEYQTLEEEFKKLNATFSDPKEAGKAYLEFLNSFERNLAFHYIDFLTEFGATELFFISGDALLMWALQFPHADFETSGGQVLTVLWTVEKFLADLQARNGTFRVFFFKEQENSQIFKGAKSLLRKVLMNHLKERTDIPFDLLEYPWDNAQAWESHLNFYQAAFFLLKLSCREQKDVDSVAFEVVQKGLLALNQTNHVLDFDEIAFEGSKVLAFSAQPSQKLAELTKELPGRLQHYLSLKCSDSQQKSQVKVDESFDSENYSLRSRVFLSAVSHYLSTANPTGKQVFLSKLFLRYLQTLEELPLRSRCHSLPKEFKDSEVEKSIVEFSQKISEIADSILQKFLEENTQKLSDRDAKSLADLFDFKLFAVVAILGEEEAEESKDWEKVSKGKTLPQGEKIGASQFKAQLLQASQSNVSSHKNVKVNRFHSQLLEEVIPDLLEKRYANSETVEKVEEPEQFKENFNTLSTDKSGEDSLSHFEFEKKAEPERKAWKVMKSKQQAEAALLKYSQNLLQDSVIKRVVLTQEDTVIERQRKIRDALESLNGSDSKQEKEEKKPKSKKVEKVVVKKKDLIIQKNKEEKHTKNQSSHQTKLEHFNALLKAALKTGKYAGNEVKKILADIEKHAVECFGEKQYTVGVDAVLAIADFWVSMQGKEDFKSRFIIERIFCLLQLILRNSPAEEISATQKGNIVKIAGLTGYQDFVADLEAHLEYKPPVKKGKGKEEKEEKKKVSKTSAIRYQLLNLSYNLTRPKGKAQDLRVNFMPDDWQKKLLDVIDAEESALICAATSSGKTFASFYAMESVLRYDSNSVMVFVAPSKALVNQMEAEIAARFSKNYKNPGKYVTGVFTRDYRKNMDSCQVLVTVPACLEILLLTPSRVNWTKTIKYVVLDEVHCLGQENGEVWQRLLLMLNCPFLALSATIGNLNQLYEWMKGISESKGKRMHLVHHKERYNYLKLTYLDMQGEIQPLNPLFAINTKTLIKTGELPDVKLLPQDCIQTLEILGEIKGVSEELTNLQPEKFFDYLKHQKTWNIGMKDASDYENAVKKKFVEVLTRFPEETERVLKKHDKGMKTHPVSKDEDVFQLLEKMRERELLPSIVFHLNRAGCESYALNLSSKLEKQEEEHRRRKGTQVQIDKLKEAIERESVRAKKDRDTIEQANAEGKAIPPDVEIRYKNLIDLQNKYNLLSKVDPKFAFFPRNVSVTMDDIKEHWKWADKNDPLIKALMRGIGVHHGGLDKGYRKAVERMFRLKQLAVIFGTVTLSLGLNMPCKSVVICKDSIHNNGIQFRQMSGRAGRRGFDLEGTVILAGLPESKIKRLLANRLPDIISSSPVTPTSVLRLMTQYSETKDPTALETTKAFVKHPLFFSKSKEVTLTKETVMGCHMLFSAEYLLNEGIVNSSGVPSGFAGVVHHLFYLEPQNFWVTVLLKSGAFDSLVDSSMLVEDQQLRLVEVLANIFFRIPLHNSVEKDKLKGPSQVVLPPLPKKFSLALKEHEERLKSHTINFAHWFVQTFSKDLPKEDQLPLSGLTLEASENSEKNQFNKKISEACGGRETLSAFPALSGVQEESSSLHEICDTFRTGVAIDKSILPIASSEIERYNSFAVDFLRHGITSALIRYNKIRHEVLWESLREFSLVLATLSVEARKRADALKTGTQAAAATAKLFEGTAATFKSQFEKSFATAGNAIPVSGVN